MDALGGFCLSGQWSQNSTSAGCHFRAPCLCSKARQQKLSYEPGGTSWSLFPYLCDVIATRLPNNCRSPLKAACVQRGVGLEQGLRVGGRLPWVWLLFTSHQNSFLPNPPISPISASLGVRPHLICWKGETRKCSC